MAIAGAGPAGAATALLLARAGHDVALFDRAEFPRAKACGDCLSPQANRLLAELGLLERVLAANPARLEGWQIHARNGACFSARFQDCTNDPALQHGLALERRTFDQILLQAARDAGVRIFERQRVDRVRFENELVVGAELRGADGRRETVASRLLVGADGLKSVVRRQLDLGSRPPRLRKVAFTARIAGVAGLQRAGEMHLGSQACIGLAPVDGRSTRANFTLVVDAERWGRALRGKCRRALWQQIDRFPMVRDRVDRSAFDRVDLMAAGPFDWPARGLTVAGAALVGDAAGYYDPFTGQGIYQALYGARTLAGHAHEMLRQDVAAPLRDYERELSRLTWQGRLVQRAIEIACASPAISNSGIAALSRSPLAARALIAVTGDLRPPLSLFSPHTLGSLLAGFLRPGRS